jgi:eukaryotic-like serine/threonine-protein kinase
MAKKLKVGDEINGYRITRVFGPGAMAISYAAEGAGGQRVFFKQYKSPSVTLDWYRPYVRYQKELNRRIEESPARNYCVRLLEAFEAVWGGRTYFQVFELIENGNDLGGILEDEHRSAGGRGRAISLADPRLWERHVIWAKVLMSGVHALHQARVAHCDLKPDNAFLIEDPSISAGYQLKLIDFDFSVLTDEPAPWHGKQGYVGTDNYRSPEHLTVDAMPGAASDVFTCGLILYELLAGRHPYWSDDQAEYARQALSHSAPRPELGGTMPAPANNEAVAEILHRCLAPRPEDRPTAAEVRDVLTGRAGAAVAGTTSVPGSAGEATAPTAAEDFASDTVAPGDAAPVPFPPPAAASEPTPAAERTSSPSATGDEALLRSQRIELTGESGRSMSLGVRTPLGKHAVRQFGDDFVHWDTEQCTLERRPDGVWQVVPAAGTTNETLLNGVAIAAPQPLCENDVIAVGREAKGIAKLPLTVRSA